MLDEQYPFLTYVMLRRTLFLCITRAPYASELQLPLFRIIIYKYCIVITMPFPFVALYSYHNHTISRAKRTLAASDMGFHVTYIYR